jgi:hypothetical protein
VAQLDEPADAALLPATRVLEMFRSRDLSPLELMHAVVAKIDRLNPTAPRAGSA